MPRRPPVAVSLLSGALLLSGCSGRSSSGPVAVPVPSASASAVARACTALAGRLPQTLGDGLRRRPVTGDPQRTAAWGDPAVTLQCGVPRGTLAGTPVSLAPDDKGPLVDFTAATGRSATRYTTTAKAVNVTVTVPDRYDSSVLQDLVPALRGLPDPSAAPGA